MEIKRVVNIGYGTIYRYIKDVPILPEYAEQWKIKRGGSKNKSIKGWNESKLVAKKIVSKLDSRDRMLILACLYWGEGNKTELNLINGDPALVRVVIRCLKELGISNSEINLSLRLFSDIDKEDAVKFWVESTGLNKSNIIRFEIIEGKKVGKLAHGMCRVRVRKGARHFKLIMSVIDLIKSEIY